MLPESTASRRHVDVIRLIVDHGEIAGSSSPDRHARSSPAWRGSRPAGRDRRLPAAPARRHPRQRLADKAARFVDLCDAFGIPLVFLVDVPGFMVGTKVEAAGIIRHGAKMLHADRLRHRAEGHRRDPQGLRGRLYVMNGRAYEPDLIVAWPSAEISVMGTEGRGDRFASRCSRPRTRPREGGADQRLPRIDQCLHGAATA